MSAGRLAVVGTGRMGLSLAADLADAELFTSIQVVGRRATGPGAESTDAADAREATPDVLIFCVPDDRLARVAAEWAAAPRRGARVGDTAGGTDGHGSRGIALHTSGLHSASILAPLSARGWRVGSWHPLVAIATPRREAFRGVAVGLEGDAEAVSLGRRLAETLGARPLPLRREAKAHYHAGAVFASNFLLACLFVAQREISRAVAESGGPDDLLPVEHLLPLARSALENVARQGLTEGATGPVARGDVGTVTRHLAALDARTGALYRALASELLRHTAAGASAEARERLTGLLESEVTQPSD